MDGTAALYTLVVTSIATLLLTVFKMGLDYMEKGRARRWEVEDRNQKADVASAVSQVAAKAEVVAQKVAAVAEGAVNTDAKLDQMQKVQNATHKMVNGGMGTQLRLVADQAKVIYSLQPTEANKATMDQHEAAYQKHTATETKT